MRSVPIATEPLFGPTGRLLNATWIGTSVPPDIHVSRDGNVTAGRSRDRPSQTTSLPPPKGRPEKVFSLLAYRSISSQKKREQKTGPEAECPVCAQQTGNKLYTRRGEEKKGVEEERGERRRKGGEKR